MRLQMESRIVGSSTTLLHVTGIIDWSTLAQFRAGLSPYVSRPRPDVLVDLSGLLSWSPQAQAVLVHAFRQARLQGGRFAVIELAPVPSLQARQFGLYKVPGLFPPQAATLATIPRPRNPPRPDMDSPWDLHEQRRAEPVRA